MSNRMAMNARFALVALFSLIATFFQPVTLAAVASSVVFSNLSEGSTSTPIIMRSNSPAGMKFTADGNSTITEIKWKLSSSNTNSIQATLFSDTSNHPGTYLGALTESAYDSLTGIRTYSGSVEVSGDYWLVFQCASCANQTPLLTSSTNKTGAWSHTYTAPISNPTRVFMFTQGDAYSGIDTTISGSFAWDKALMVEITATPSADTTPPTVSSTSPSDGASTVGISSNLVFNFSENVDVVAGKNITLVNSNDAADNRIIAVDDAQVTGSGTSQITINPTANLLVGADYHVLIDAGAFEDASANAFAGISSSSTLNFTTIGAPTLSSTSPSDDAVSVPNNSNLVLNFSRAVNAVAGKSLRLVKTSSSSATSIAVDGAQVTGSGTTQITINPTNDLDIFTDYHVEIDAGAFVDSEGIGNAAINNFSDLNFTTSPIPYSGLTVALDAAVASSYSGSGSTWTDISGSGNNLTLYNTPTFDTTGGIKSLGFQSANLEYGDFAATNLLNRDAYTKLVWFKPTGLTAVNNLFSSRGTSAHAFWGGGNNASCPAAGDNLAAGHNGSWYEVSSNECMDSEWQLGVVSFDATDGWRLYRNGSQVASSTDTTRISDSNLGYYTQVARYSTNYYFDGLIAQVYLYNRALSADEINSIYEATAATFGQNLDTVNFNASGGEVDIASIRTDINGDVTLRTPTKANAVLLGWYTSPVGGTKVGDPGDTYTPGGDVTLYAQWDASYTVTYSAGTNATGAAASASYLASTGALTLPTPTRSDYVFQGWYTAASGGSKVGNAGAAYVPTSDLTLHGRWVQASLAGIAASDLTEVNSTTVINGVGSSNTHTIGSSSVAVTIPANAFSAGVVVKVYSVANNGRAQAVLPNESDFVNSMVVAWTAPDTTVPIASIPLSMVITDSSIKTGAKVYSIVGDQSTLLATATQDGTVSISFTTDPLVTIANPATVVNSGSGGGGGVSTSTPTVLPKLDSGQLPTGQAGKTFTVTLFGSNLNLITKVMLGEKELSFDSSTSSQIEISIPPQLAGDLSLSFVHAQGLLLQAVVVEEKISAAVNAGAFNGVVAVYAKGYLGSRLSAKIGEDWLIVDSIKVDFARFTEKVRWKGAPLMVRIYIDGVLQRTVSIVTK